MIAHKSNKSTVVVGLQGLREEIDSRLSKVQEIRFEPRLLSEDDDRLKHGSQISKSPF